MKNYKTHIVILSLIALLAIAGLAEGLQKALHDFRFQFSSSESTGQITLIAIDHKAIEELETWPWPRKYHAEIIDKLIKIGVKDIVFDIDFSSRTTPENDKAFEEALKRAGGSVVLPVFKQLQSTDENKFLIKTSQPLKEFREQAWLASVNIVPGRNGHVETMAYGHMINKNFIPSFAAILTGRHEENAKPFFINFSIDAKSIPTFSYVDILKDRINPQLLKGRKVVIGATATELGDYVYTPAQGLLSGPGLQILAAETLLQNKELHQINPLVSYLGLFLLAALLSLSAVRAKMVAQLYLFPLAAIAIETAAILLQIHAHVLVNTSLWHLTLLAYCLVTLLQEVDIRKFLVKITQAKLDNTRTMFEQVFNDSFSSVVITDDKGKIQAISKSTIQLLNLDETSKLEGQLANNMLPEEMVEAGKDLLAKINEDGHPRHRAGMTRQQISETEHRYLEYVITLSTLKSTDEFNTDNHLVCYKFHDITAKQESEMAQKKATEAAIEANKAKTEFLDQMSHELRTPLNSIIGFSTIIESKAMNKSEQKETCEFACEIKQNGENLLKVVNDIIYMTKIESHSLPFNEGVCDPLDIVDQAIVITSSQHRESELNIVTEHKDSLPMIRGDFQLSTDAVAEVLSNAIKFSPDSSEIKIASSMDKAGNLIISVTDKGIGIEEAHLDKIYEAFYQVDSTATRSFEGTGLGLTKAKAFMNMHHGDIKTISTPDFGTAVFLIFPEQCVINDLSSAPETTSPEPAPLKLSA